MRIFVDVHETLAGFKACELEGRSTDVALWGNWFEGTGKMLQRMKRMRIPSKYQKWEGTHPCLQEVFEESVGDFWCSWRNSEDWEYLPKMPWADELMNMVDAIGNVYLLTSPPRGAPEGITGTYNWVKRHYPSYERKCIFCPTEEKYLLCSSPEDVVIDDSPKVWDSWEALGGRIVRIPSLFMGYENTDWSDPHYRNILLNRARNIITE